METEKRYHCKPKPIYKPTKFEPKLIGYQCEVHGEILTPNLSASQAEASRPLRQFAAPSKFFTNKKHAERMRYASPGNSEA